MICPVCTQPAVHQTTEREPIRIDQTFEAGITRVTWTHADGRTCSR